LQAAAVQTPTPVATPSKMTFVDKAYSTILTPSKMTATSPIAGVANQALTSTLAPQGTQAMSGMGGDAFGGQIDGGYTQDDYDNMLAAFGTPSMFQPNPNGRRIGPADVEEMTKHLGTNIYQQERESYDLHLPAGHEAPDINTMFGRHLTNINRGGEQANQDMLRQIDNYNAYWGIKDANQSLTIDELNAMIADPSKRPQGPVDYMQGVRVPNLQNMSMLNTSFRPPVF
jgi:hypothetical protein